MAGMENVVKKDNRLSRTIVMIAIMFCVFWMGGERCLAQTKGQIICTNNNTDYPNAKVLDVDDKDFFASTYKRKNEDYYSNPFELHITEDTTLVINGPIKINGTKYRQANNTKTSVTGSINYLEGIIVYPGNELTIRLEYDGDFYTYGKKEPHSNNTDWICHAGIEVAYTATVIIEQTKNVNGRLIAVGAGSKYNGDVGHGTGAGIGGRGYEFFLNKDIYEGDVVWKNGTYTWADCGNVIIRSGKVYACGGCGIGADGKGTGSGIGGGGVWRGTETKHGGTIYSSRGGEIIIYGGYVEAYGGGTYNDNGSEKNIYANVKDIFFNSNNGFYVTNISSKNDQAEGTGSGIGSGGIYTDRETTIYMQNRLDLKYYAGCVNAFAGRGSNRYTSGYGDARGVGAGIGGGGCFASDSSIKGVHFYTNMIGEFGYTYKYSGDGETVDTNSDYIKANHKSGVGSSYSSSTTTKGILMTGGVCCNGDDYTNFTEDGPGKIELRRLPDSGLKTSSMYDYGSNAASYSYPVYKFPTEAYSDIVAPKIDSMSYTVEDFENLEDSDIGDTIAGKSFAYTTPSYAIDAKGIGITGKSYLVAKIVVSDKDAKYVGNFGYTMGHGIKEIKTRQELQDEANTITVRNMYESYSTGKVKKILPNVYIKVTEGGYFDSKYRGTNVYNANDSTGDRLTFYASCVEVYIITREDFNIVVKDIVDKQKSSSAEVEMPEFNESLDASVQYIIKTEEGGTYADMQESYAFEGVKTGETVKEEKLIITVTSSLFGTADAIQDIILKSKDVNTGEYCEVDKVSNKNVLEYTSTQNITYTLYVKSKFGTEVSMLVTVTKIGEKKEGGDSSFPIPSLLPLSQTQTVLGDILSDTTISYLLPDSPVGPSSPGDVAKVSSVGKVSSLQVDVSGINLGEISEGDSNVSRFASIGLMFTNNLDKINWNNKHKVDWGREDGRVDEITLRYKDAVELDSRNLPLYQDSQIRSPLDVDDTIYTNGNSKSYVVGYYTQERTKSGNGYTTLENYSGTYTDSAQKTVASTKVVDIPYEGDKAISIRCEYSNGRVRAILDPARLVIGSRVKEVGVRVEYELNGRTTGLVHKWNYVDGQNGEFEWSFANIPKNNVKYSAYYINSDNEEFSTTPA